MCVLRGKEQSRGKTFKMETGKEQQIFFVCQKKRDLQLENEIDFQKREKQGENSMAPKLGVCTFSCCVLLVL